MDRNLGNIYKMARKASGLTQEVAAEYLKISAETLSKYENGKVVPNSKMVARMVHIYETPWLMVQHVEETDHGAQLVYPKIPITQFGLSVLRAEIVVDELNRHMGTLRRIAQNNRVDDPEYPDWVNVTTALMEAAGALIGVVNSIQGDPGFACDFRSEAGAKTDQNESGGEKGGAFPCKK